VPVVPATGKKIHPKKSGQNDEPFFPKNYHPKTWQDLISRPASPQTTRTRCRQGSPFFLHFKPTWGRCYDHNFLLFFPIFGGKIGVFLKKQCYDQNFA
jgi:hypothetical protein